MGLRVTTPAHRHVLAPWRRRASRQWTRPKPRAWSEERLLDAIPSLPRASLARITERMIDRMDEIDGDPGEANGDELDGSIGEDDFHPQSADWMGYAGCPVSGPGEDGDDAEACDHD